jgi:hypothetical protein
MVPATRSIMWRTERSRAGVPSGPRKYFCATMLVALSDQVAGNSTPRCSKATVPSRQFVITASRCSHAISSYGWTPSVVKRRSTVRPLRRPTFAVESASLVFAIQVPTSSGPRSGATASASPEEDGAGTRERDTRGPERDGGGHVMTYSLVI